MLSQLKTRYFRKLENNTFEFGPGLQVVRGANEQGKSTMLEAIGYGIGGVKACREPLDKVVTWGAPTKLLKVEQVWNFDGVTYNLKRGPSGAEITWEAREIRGGELCVEAARVTGQKEVTAKMAELLNADTATMTRLNLAKQGALRGALEEGPAKTMAMIEQLAGFDVVDRVIELIQTHLITGPTAMLEDRVARAEQAHAAAQAAWLPYDPTYHNIVLKGITEEISQLVKQIDSELKPVAERAQAVVTDLQAEARSRENLQSLLQQLTHQHGLLEIKQVDAIQRANTRPPEEALAAAEARLRAEQGKAPQLVAYREITKLAGSYPEAYWEGDLDSFNVELKSVIKRWTEKRADAQARLTELNGLKLGEWKQFESCSSCNRPFDDAAHRAEHNARQMKRLKELSTEVDSLYAEFNGLDKELAALQTVQAHQTTYERAASVHAEWVDVFTNAVPWMVTWRGDEPTPANVDGAQRELRAMRSAAAAAEGAAGEVRALSVQADEVRGRIIAVRAQLDTFGDVETSLATALEVFSDANGRYQDAFARLTLLQQEGRQLEQQIARGLEDDTRYREALARAAEQLEAEKLGLDLLIFNNTLLKRVRSARPVIADRLWTIVLAAVSSYFSAMRGEVSNVTRTDNEFMVDGHSIEGLSGSTLDLLGISIRLALTRTFLPNSSFLALDEPAAAMDEPRTQALLGFLVAAGFQQTLLVTHDELSESVAQNLVTL